MTEKDALYAAVLAAPADDLPRLVFADWCDDHGDHDRAEFIRVQVELARLPADAPARRPLEEREDELLITGHDLWKVPGIRGVQGFVRGFVERWDGTADWLLAAAGRLFESAPVRAIRIANADKHVGSLYRLPGLSQVESLDLSGNTLAAGNKLERLLNTAPLGSLRSLKVGNNRLFADALPQIVGSPVACQLTSLDLSGNPLADEGLTALAHVTRFGRLESLALRSNEQTFEDSVHIAGATQLAGSDNYPVLKSLDLSGHHIQDAGFLALLASPLGQRLTTLKLAQNDIGDVDDDWGSWLADPMLPAEAPRWLDLSGRRNAIGPRTAEMMARWQALACGVTVDVRWCLMSESARATLAGSPFAANILLDPRPPEMSA